MQKINVAILNPVFMILFMGGLVVPPPLVRLLRVGADRPRPVPRLTPGA
ncbi:hypothetical protein [Nonomuraea sp. NPDC003754]